MFSLDMQAAQAGNLAHFLQSVAVQAALLPNAQAGNACANITMLNTANLLGLTARLNVL